MSKTKKQYRGIAQLVEQRSPKPRAEGSNPSAPAIFLKVLYAAMAQSVERVLGKDEVTGSNPDISSIALALSQGFFDLNGW